MDRETLLRLDPWIDVLENGGTTFERVSTLVARRGWKGAETHPEVQRLLQISVALAPSEPAAGWSGALTS